MDIRHAVGVKAGVPAETLAAILDYRDNPRFTEREQAALASSASAPPGTIWR